MDSVRRLSCRWFLCRNSGEMSKGRPPTLYGFLTLLQQVVPEFLDRTDEIKWSSCCLGLFQVVANEAIESCGSLHDANRHSKEPLLLSLSLAFGYKLGKVLLENLFLPCHLIEGLAHCQPLFREFRRTYALRLVPFRLQRTDLSLPKPGIAHQEKEDGCGNKPLTNQNRSFHFTPPGRYLLAGA